MESRVAQLEALVGTLTDGLREQQARAQAAEQRLAAAEATATREGAANGATGTTTRTSQSLVDTRVLGKPPSFDGRPSSWRGFKFRFVAYCAAIDPQLRTHMVSAETTAPADLVNTRLTSEMRAMSVQLYYMLTMLCEEPVLRHLEAAGECEGFLTWEKLVAEFEPRTAGRHAGMLLELLRFPFEGDPRGALD